MASPSRRPEAHIRVGQARAAGLVSSCDVQQIPGLHETYEVTLRLISHSRLEAMGLLEGMGCPSVNSTYRAESPASQQ